VGLSLSVLQGEVSRHVESPESFPGEYLAPVCFKQLRLISLQNTHRSVCFDNNLDGTLKDLGAYDAPTHDNGRERGGTTKPPIVVSKGFMSLTRYPVAPETLGGRKQQRSPAADKVAAKAKPPPRTANGRSLDSNSGPSKSSLDDAKSDNKPPPPTTAGNARLHVKQPDGFKALRMA